MKTKITIDAALHVAKRYVKGHCLAIRFAPDMSAEDIRDHLRDAPPTRSEWHRYNETIDQFIP